VTEPIPEVQSNKNYKTHKVPDRGIHCDACSRPLDKSESFAVVSTASRPYKNLCLTCTDKSLESMVGNPWVDPT